MLPNWSQVLPDAREGRRDPRPVTGPVSDRDTFSDAGHRGRHDLRRRPVAAGSSTCRYDLGRLDDGFYVRLRGSDGKRLAVGLNGAAVDPAGPAIDVVGDADPWQDLWFYTNPMWVLPRR